MIADRLQARLAHPSLRPLGLGLGQSGGNGFSPASLFANGEQGAWFAPSPTTCFTDTARTIPAAVGDLVAGMTDLSGRGHHAAQSTSGNRPTLRQSGALFYLDGANCILATNSIDMSASDALTIWLGIEKLSDAAAGVVLELSTNTSSGANQGSFYVAAPEDTGASGNFSFKSRGSIDPTPAKTGTVLSPAKRVLTAIGRISTDTQIIRLNGVQAGTSSSDQGTGNYGSYQLFIGARSGPNIPFNGRFFGGIVRSGAAVDPLLGQTEIYMAGLTGVTL
jgi:hypothetical protein